ncbi:hypothetical protein REPUB_Repub01dG0061500 [Reevesia pubescens]
MRYSTLVICRDHQGQWLFGFTRKFGTGHISKAEIYAIYTGLLLAWEQGYRMVMVESDSLIAIRKIQQPLRDLDPLFNVIHEC